jgi:hypothetical protein
MDIRKPERTIRDGKWYLHMFCPEHRIDREIYWAGFGFQVWCQMLTSILQARASSLLIVDEPDIYLHSDLQRQLVRLLEGLGPEILLATHSTEIVSEVEPESILQINRKWKSAKRFSGSKQLNDIFLTLGSRLNPALTELAKTRVVLFLEGQDFKILSKFGRKLDLQNVASRSGFAIVPSGGFNPQKVLALAEGMEISLGLSLSKAVIFDRDFRSSAEVTQLRGELERKFDIVAIHSCKEIENFLLSLEPLTRAIQKRIKAQKRSDDFTSAQTASILDKVTAGLKSDVFGQLCTRQKDFLRRTNRTVDESAIVSEIHTEFENSWKDLARRLTVVPGKRIISLLNDYLQEEFSVSVSATGIAECFEKEEISVELGEILRRFEELCDQATSST